MDIEHTKITQGPLAEVGKAEAAAVPEHVKHGISGGQGTIHAAHITRIQVNRIRPPEYPVFAAEGLTAAARAYFIGGATVRIDRSQRRMRYHEETGEYEQKGYDMYQGKLTTGEIKKLIKAKEVIDAWVRWQRRNPASFNPAQTYVAQDASKAIETFIATLQG